MNYNEIINLFKSKTEEFKGSLYFGNGTLKELNEKDNIGYPLLWVMQPMNIGLVRNNDSSIIGQSFKVNVRILQSGAIDLSQDEVNKNFDETLRIMNGFIHKIDNDFSDEDSEDLFNLGDATQIYREQDNVHIGWNLPITIVTSIDNDCCELFNGTD